MIARIAVICTGLLVIAFAAGAAPSAYAQPATEFTLPAPTGRYVVGRLFEDWTDEGRIDPLATIPGTKRILPVTIWYPARVADIPAPTSYFPSPLREHFPVDVSKYRSHAIDGAAMSPDRRRYPVLLLKPAFGSLALQHSALAEDLASHGYIVVGSDSPYTTPLVVYRDGSMVKRNEKGAPRSTEVQPDALAPGEANGATLVPFRTWVEDNRFIVDRLERLDAGAVASRFARRLNLGAIGAFGHSYGGAAALEFCRADSRCKAAVNIDGAPLGEVVLVGLRAPSLFIFSDRPAFRTGADEGSTAQRALLAAIGRIKANLPNKPNQVILVGSGHFNFADAALYQDLAAARRMGALGSIDPLVAIRDTNALLRAFFDTHLNGGAAGALRAVTAGHPEMVSE